MTLLLGLLSRRQFMPKASTVLAIRLAMIAAMTTEGLFGQFLVRMGVRQRIPACDGEKNQANQAPAIESFLHYGHY